MKKNMIFLGVGIACGIALLAVFLHRSPNGTLNHGTDLPRSQQNIPNEDTEPLDRATLKGRNHKQDDLIANSERQAEDQKNEIQERDAVLPTVIIDPVSPPSHLAVLMGTTGEGNYLVRNKELRKLGRNLGHDEIQALYLLLNKKQHEDPLDAAELNGLKDAVANRLEAQHSFPERYPHNLMAMFYDQQHAPVWRDYCVQHLGNVLARMQKQEEKVTCVDLFWQATGEIDGTIAGTALIALTRNVDDADIDAAAVADKALKLCRNTEAGTPTKITALQVCSSLNKREVLPIARSILQSNSSAVLRMSALAAIGSLGDKTDRPLLEEFAASSDLRLQTAATSALKRLHK